MSGPRPSSARERRLRESQGSRTKNDRAWRRRSDRLLPPCSDVGLGRVGGRLMSDFLLDAVASSDAVRDAVSDADGLVARRVLGSDDATLRSRPGVEFNADALEAVALRAVHELG